jgi:hypothetical protein
VTLKELWAGASPQHRTAARKLLLLDRSRVVFTIGDLLNKPTATLSRPGDGASSKLCCVLAGYASTSASLLVPRFCNTRSSGPHDEIPTSQAVAVSGP